MSSNFSARRDKPSDNNSRFNLNFDFSQIPLPNLRVPNLSQTFGSAPGNFSRFMSPLRADRRNNSPHCDNCESKFNILTKRKKTCLDCSMDFCTDCFIRETSGSRYGKCRKCFIFSRYPLDRASLMSLRVRDLRWFLARRHIQARYCKEKTDLVELILQSNSNTYQSSSREFTYPSSSERNENDNDSESTDSNWVFINTDEDVSSPTATSIPSSATTTTTTSNRDQEAQESDLFTNNNVYNNYVYTESNDAPTNVNDSNASSEAQLFNISDIKSEEDIQTLTVRQMKLLLTRNFVDYKGCCEKEELVKKTTRLWKEFNQQEHPDLIKDENLCKICMEAEINCVLLECGHMVTCNNCGKNLNECPICRQYVVRVIRTFKS